MCINHGLALRHALQWVKKLLIIAFVCLTLVAFAGDSDAEKKVFVETLKLAEQGNANAQYELGVMYLGNREQWNRKLG